jgi:hypothetical protein
MKTWAHINLLRATFGILNLNIRYWTNAIDLGYLTFFYLTR